MTILGLKTSKEVIKLEKGYWCGPKSNIMGVLIRKRDQDTDTQNEDHVKTQGEVNHL